MVAAQWVVPVPRQSVPLCLDPPIGLAPFRFPQGLLCPDPLDPSVGPSRAVLFLLRRRRHLWRGLPQEPSGKITQSSTNPTNMQNARWKANNNTLVHKAPKPLDTCVRVSQVCVLFQVKTRLGVRSPRDCCTGRRPTGTLPSVAAAPLTLTYWDYPM